MRVLCLVLRMIGTAENMRGRSFNPVATNIWCMRFLLFLMSLPFTSVGCLVTKVQLPLDATLSQSKSFCVWEEGTFSYLFGSFGHPKILSLLLPDHAVFFWSN
jgi:hypothetical protein